MAFKVSAMNPKDAVLLNCNSYEDYLDTFINKNDLKYLKNIKFSRMLVELGYRSTSAILNAEQFELRKDVIQETFFPTKTSLVLFSMELSTTDPVLLELAARERPNYQKNISTIIFLRYKTKGGFEISGYIDYDDSLRRANKKLEDSVDWKAVFDGKNSLKPKSTDLSYYHGRSSHVVYNHSPNYFVRNDPVLGLIFMYKGDRKIICVDPNSTKPPNATRTMVYSQKYGYVTMYDHVVRRKV